MYVHNDEPVSQLYGIFSSEKSKEKHSTLNYFIYLFIYLFQVFIYLFIYRIATIGNYNKI